MSLPNHFSLNVTEICALETVQTTGNMKMAIWWANNSEQLNVCGVTKLAMEKTFQMSNKKNKNSVQHM